MTTPLTELVGESGEPPYARFEHGTLTRFLRTRLLAQMRALRDCELRIVEAGAVELLGTPAADPRETLHAEVVVRSPEFYRRVAANGSVGVAEGIFMWLYKLSGRPEILGFSARLSLRITEWLIALTGYLVYLRMRSEVREIQHEVEEDSEKQETGDGKQETGDGAPAATS